MKNLLTQWELRRKTDFKLEPQGLLLLGLVAEAVKWPAALPFGAAGPSRWRSNRRGSGPSWVKLSQVKLSWANSLRVNHRRLSHQKCSVNKRQSHFKGKKNDKLIIGKKPPNPVGTEEENQSRKDLIIAQSSKINLCDQWCIELFYSQSTLRPGLYLGDLTRLHPVKLSLPATTLLPHGEIL